MTLGSWLLVGAAAGIVGLVLYWQLVVTEGTYLGTGVVTFLYDITASRYDSIKDFEPRFEEMFLGRPLTRALRDVPAPFVLDVGTGTGRLPLALFEEAGFNGRVVALDSSRRMLAIAASKLAPFAIRLDLLWMDGTSLPFLASTFDAVTGLEMLEFTPNPSAQLAEMVRVLRPGGVLLTTRRRGFDARLMPGKTLSREAFRKTLEALGLRDVNMMPWQMDYDLVWAVRGGKPEPGIGGARPLVQVLHCPVCKEVALMPDGAGLTCSACATNFETRDHVVELRRRAANSSRAWHPCSKIRVHDDRKRQ